MKYCKICGIGHNGDTGYCERCFDKLWVNMIHDDETKKSNKSKKIDYIKEFNRILSYLGYKIKLDKTVPSLNEKFILIYHMGKVASNDMRDSLLNHHNLNINVYKVSFMSYDKFKRYYHDYMTLQSMKLRKRIEVMKKKKIRFKVITMEREPVGKHISTVFQNLYAAFPHIKNSKIPVSEGD